MKRIKVLLAIALSVVMMLTACGGASIKGEWRGEVCVADLVEDELADDFEDYFYLLEDIYVPVVLEITYGLERIAMYLQNVDSVFDIKWNDTLKYGDIYLQNEIEQSKYNFEYSTPENLFKQFDLASDEAHKCMEAGIVLPAYDWVLKCSHTFNLLDARGVISKDERVNYINRVRTLAAAVAKLYVEQREKLGFPLIKK